MYSPFKLCSEKFINIIGVYTDGVSILVGCVAKAIPLCKHVYLARQCLF